MDEVTLHEGDCREVLRSLAPESVHCVVTSPPYWGLRDYGLPPAIWGGVVDCEHEWGEQITENATKGAFCRRCGSWRGCLGLEPSPELYVAHVVEVMRKVRRVLRKDGTLWLNLGSSYAGSGKSHSKSGSLDGYKQATNRGSWSGLPTAAVLLNGSGFKPKDLVPTDWLVALALQTDGWYLRSAITWCKGSPMPESVKDRPTSATEMLFLLSRSPRYFYDQDAVRVPYQQSSIERILQPTFDSQTGGDKDYANGTNRNKSARKALEGLKRMNTPNKERKLEVPTRPNNHRGSSVPWEDSGAGRNLWDWWLINPQPMSDWIQTDHQIRVESDAADGDTTHRVSPDCREHEGLAGWASSDGYDGRAGVQWPCKCGSGYHDLEQVSGSVPIEPNFVADSGLESLDSPQHGGSQTAIDHNRGSRKMVHAPETMQPCMPSVGTPYGTQRSEELCESSERHPGRIESNILQDEMGAHSQDRTLGNSGDIASCLCSFTQTITRSISHFATFPEKLVEPCIKAGTSQKGCCVDCGASWVRETKRGSLREHPGRRNRTDRNKADYDGMDYAVRESTLDLICETETVDWRPSCTHGGEPVPATVLDPFSGAGTTGVVAAKLHRNYIGIELNPPYNEIAQRRIQRAIQERDYGSDAPEQIAAGQLTLDSALADRTL